MGICNSTSNRQSRIERRIRTKNIINNESMISENTCKELSKSLCKVTLQSENNEFYATGFFMYIELFNQTKKCLLTNHNNISQKTIDSKEVIIIQLENGAVTSISLDGTKRYIKCLKYPLNITIIEILNIDSINNDIEFLFYDSNYTHGYEQYLNQNILSLNQSMNGNKDFSIGKISALFLYFFFPIIFNKRLDLGSFSKI